MDPKDWNPKTLLATSGGYWATCALHAGVKLGVFSLLADGLGGPYDVAWLSHILHGEPPQDCERIVQKAASALLPGGLLLIHEFMLKDTKDGPLFPALFSLNMLLGTPGGRSYSQGELSLMLEKAGARQIRRLDHNGGPAETGILAGII